MREHDPYRQATGPADAPHWLLRSCVSLSHTHPEIFGLLITDIDHLPDDERHAIRRAQHEHVSASVAAICTRLLGLQDGQPL